MNATELHCLLINRAAAVPGLSVTVIAEQDHHSISWELVVAGDIIQYNYRILKEVLRCHHPLSVVNAISREAIMSIVEEYWSAYDERHS